MCVGKGEAGLWERSARLCQGGQCAVFSPQTSGKTTAPTAGPCSALADSVAAGRSDPVHTSTPINKPVSSELTAMMLKSLEGMVCHM